MTAGTGKEEEVELPMSTVSILQNEGIQETVRLSGNHEELSSKKRLQAQEAEYLECARPNTQTENKKTNMVSFVSCIFYHN